MRNTIAIVAGLLLSLVALGKTFNENLKVNGNVTVNGAETVTSTTTASHPCPSMTTTQINATTPSDGDCAYDTTLHFLKVYENGSWLVTGNSYDNSTITVNGSSQLIVKSGGITGTQVASNINLPGKSVQANSLDVVVSAANPTNGLEIMRGTVDNSTTKIAGEGFTVSRSSNVVTVAFSSAFGDVPSCTASFSAGLSSGTGIHIYDAPTTAAFNIQVEGGNTAWFSFVCIGPRA